MTSPLRRKVLLTAHIVASVGWLGAVAAFLVLSIVGLSSSAPDLVRSASVSMNLLGLYLVVPWRVQRSSAGSFNR